MLVRVVRGLAELSPMMRLNILRSKSSIKTRFSFSGWGDFYEMFYDDALLASKELELTLTGRDCGQEERAPMCGVPYHSCESYIARLIAKGYKVAICEQMEDPAKAKGLVKRDIIRVITPRHGSLRAAMLDDAREQLYRFGFSARTAGRGLLCRYLHRHLPMPTQLEEGDLDAGIIGELCRFSPSELLFNSEILKTQINYRVHQEPYGLLGRTAG